ncbi:hypothetical protein ACO2Q9_08705 [Variovorax sp. VNK109]|jgi:cytochrome c-type biogenesis protein CcmH/NrfG|uniref:hypothetical protein n=1 Tax=Variovorax sp. VNK109 TaxID=3400919 RepID=UPI003C05C645
MQKLLLTGGVVVALVLGGCASRPNTGTTLAGTPSMGANIELLNKQQFAGQENEASRSEALFQSLLRKIPNDADTWFRLGNLYASNNLPEPAAGAYNRALLADNSHARAWHNLGVIKLREAYAALLQAQVTVDSNDEAMAKRIDSLLEDLSRLSALEGEPRPAARPKTP